MTEHTKKGLLLIVVGSILNAFFYAMGILSKISDAIFFIAVLIHWVAMLCLLIGVILVIFGRKEFSKEHEKFVKYAVMIYIIGIIALSFISLVVVQMIGIKNLENSIVYDLNSFLYGIIIVNVGGAIFIGIGMILIAYQLHDGKGRRLVLTAFVVIVITSIITSYGLLVEYKNLGKIEVDKSDLLAIFEKTENITAEISKTTSVYQTPNFISSFMFAIAFYITYNRIVANKIKYREKEVQFAQPLHFSTDVKVPPYGFPPSSIPSTPKEEGKELPTECKYCGAKFFVGVEACPKCGAYLK